MMNWQLKMCFTLIAELPAIPAQANSCDEIFFSRAFAPCFLVSNCACATFPLNDSARRANHAQTLLAATPLLAPNQVWKLQGHQQHKRNA